LVFIATRLSHAARLAGRADRSATDDSHTSPKLEHVL